MFRSVFFFAMALGAAHSQTVDAQALLKRSDSARNGWPSYTVRVKIANFERGKQDEEHLYQVSQKGTDKTHVEFLSPREKGRYLLMLGEDMWVFLPATSRPIRITPLERLSGNTSNGDIARTNYSIDYDAAWLRTEKAGDVTCHVLELKAKRKSSTYHRIEYWIDAETARPVKAEYFLTSGKHIKSATFDEYQQVQGRVLLRRMTIRDQVRKDSWSVLEYSSYSARNLPDRLFHQSRIDRY